MPLETLFSVANLVALGGWLVLVAAPILPERARVVPRLAVPALLALGYCALLLTSWSGAEGSFSSLEGVAALFGSREVLLAAGCTSWRSIFLWEVGKWTMRDGPALPIGP